MAIYMKSIEVRVLSAEWFDEQIKRLPAGAEHRLWCWSVCSDLACSTYNDADGIIDLSYKGGIGG
jgi:hypothetical protein